MSQAERHKRWRNKKLASGLCGRCGRNPRPTGSKFHCERCSIRRRVARRKFVEVED